ncbi:hypothetical protein QR680_017084 [Steinernema hermaphroditum]|uniref:Uncharacterized protein n=1 Tax=Steinernema hermaphroditum TaxID=289476 RepID=A0AA39LNL6_9BILA|nr:hypothetical protein QR680_017084 [Steinernema hermaphroditum]
MRRALILSGIALSIFFLLPFPLVNPLLRLTVWIVLLFLGTVIVVHIVRYSAFLVVAACSFNSVHFALLPNFAKDHLSLADSLVPFFVVKRVENRCKAS